MVASLPKVCSLSPCALRRIITHGCLIGRHPSIVLGVISNAGLRHGLCLAARLARLKVPIIVTVGVVSILQHHNRGVGARGLDAHVNYGVVRVSTLGKAKVRRTTTRTVGTTNGPREGPHRIFDNAIRRTLTRVRRTAVRNVPLRERHFCTVGVFRHSGGILDSLGLSGGVLRRVRSSVLTIRSRVSSSDRDVVAGRHCRCVTEVLGNYCGGEPMGHLDASSGVSHVIAGHILTLPVFTVVVFLICCVSVNSVNGFAIKFVGRALFNR